MYKFEVTFLDYLPWIKFIVIYYVTIDIWDACRTAMIKLLQKFEEIGRVPDARQLVYHRSGLSSENIAAVGETVAQNQKT